MAYHHIAIAMNGENTEGDATAKAIVELQELMKLTCEEMEVLKTSRVTCAYKVLPQQPGTSKISLDTDSCGYCSCEAQRKHDD